MDRLEFKGQWSEVKGRLKQKYASLTDSDLAYEEGQEEEMIGRIQKRLGKTRDEVVKEIKSI